MNNPNIPEKLMQFLMVLQNELQTEVKYGIMNTNEEWMKDYQIVVGWQRFHLWQNPTGEWGWKEM